jgi:putative ABC transport system permease protein
MTLIGGAIGLAISLPLPKVLNAILSDAHISEPGLYLVVPAVILAVAMFAAYVPARRAARVDPMKALRQE